MRHLVATAAVGGLLALTTACAAHDRPAAHAVPAAVSTVVSRSVSAAHTSTPAVHSSAAASIAAVIATPPAVKPSSSTDATPSPQPPATVQVVLRPVTARGTVASGWTAARHLDESITCLPGATDASPVAVNDNIDSCSPDAAYPVACWASATPHTALCLRSPFSKQVDLMSTGSAVPSAVAAAQPTPIALVLHDGTLCTLRAGGAWTQLAGRPDLFGTYYCGSMAVWAPAHSYGINRSGASWTVQIARTNGQDQLSTVTVRTAYFVGTAG
ncbi:MAG TPA: hypothetical protein VHO01_00710 [Jatrophihabitans sp.]|nr:hypothetical protein [Jatrophihabitans sp.]